MHEFIGGQLTRSMVDYMATIKDEKTSTQRCKSTNNEVTLHFCVMTDSQPSHDGSEQMFSSYTPLQRVSSKFIAFFFVFAISSLRSFVCMQIRVQ
ncbi:hypothetical protein V3C99_011689 [Haemonchus contortus]